MCCDDFFIMFDFQLVYFVTRLLNCCSLWCAQNQVKSPHDTCSDRQHQIHVVVDIVCDFFTSWLSLLPLSTMLHLSRNVCKFIISSLILLTIYAGFSTMDERKVSGVQQMQFFINVRFSPLVILASIFFFIFIIIITHNRELLRFFLIFFHHPPTMIYCLAVERTALLNLIISQHSLTGFKTSGADCSSCSLQPHVTLLPHSCLLGFFRLCMQCVSPMRTLSSSEQQMQWKFSS